MGTHYILVITLLSVVQLSPHYSFLARPAPKPISSGSLGTWGELNAKPCCEALTQIDPQAAPDVLHF